MEASGTHALRDCREGVRSTRETLERHRKPLVFRLDVVNSDASLCPLCTVDINIAVQIPLGHSSSGHRFIMQVTRV